MKRFVAIMVVLLCAAGVSAQRVDRTVQFMSDYEAFVKEVVKMPFAEMKGDTMTHIEKTEHRFMRRYRWHFKKTMSIEQLEQFNKIRGRYSRKMTALNNRRRLAATKGRFEGFFERQDGAEEAGQAPAAAGKRQADTAKASAPAELAPRPQSRGLRQGFRTRLKPLRQQDTLEALMRAY